MFAARPLRPIGVRRPLRAAGAVAAAALVLVPWLYAVHELTHAKAVEPATKPTAIVWSGRVFSSKSAFATWLESTGRSYEAWAQRHPAAIQTLDRKAKAHVKLSGQQRSARTTARPARTTTVAASNAEQTPSERTAAPPRTTVATPRAGQKPAEKPAATPATTVSTPPSEQRPNEERTAAAPAAAQPSPVTSTNAGATVLVYSLLVVVLLMLTLAFLPPRLVAPRLEPRLAAAQSYRPHLMVGASAITLGVFMSALLK